MFAKWRSGSSEHDQVAWVVGENFGLIELLRSANLAVSVKH